MRHYCRWCPAYFDHWIIAPHATARKHAFTQHHQEEPIRCGKYCSMREQPEEFKAGHKLYGPGYVKPNSGRTDAELQRLTDMMGYDQE